MHWPYRLRTKFKDQYALIEQLNLHKAASGSQTTLLMEIPHVSCICNYAYIVFIASLVTTFSYSLSDLHGMHHVVELMI